MASENGKDPFMDGGQSVSDTNATSTTTTMPVPSSPIKTKRKPIEETTKEELLMHRRNSQEKRQRRGSGPLDRVMTEHEKPRRYSIGDIIQSHNNPNNRDGEELNPLTALMVKAITNDNIFIKSMVYNGLDTNKIGLGGNQALRDIARIFKDPGQDPLNLLLHSYTFYKYFPPSQPYVPANSPFPAVIQTQQQLEAKQRQMESLNTLYGCLELIESARRDAKEAKLSVEQVILQKLNLTIKPLLPTHNKYQAIMQYTKHTTEGTPFEVEYIFQVENPDVPSPVKDNRLLLCRGVNTVKHLAVLQNGTDGSRESSNLTANARESKFRSLLSLTGQVQFSDMFYSTLEEAFTGEEYMYIHLYEVALGASLDSEFIIRELPKGFDSLVCRGSFGPDPAQLVKTEEGYIIPAGKPRPIYMRSSLAASFSKYYVYNRENIRLRFIVQVRYTPPTATQNVGQMGQMGIPLGNVGQIMGNMGQPIGNMGQSMGNIGQPTGNMGQPIGMNGGMTMMNANSPKMSPPPLPTKTLVPGPDRLFQ
ncbi:hypothetical protein PROFUN_06870 [Planoprotostelium fungivorum]|uniref:NAD(+) ADP-ribosyltransferase n=1 Tax=Planoprotostelium fungivorum TaxID=1890364 RepID=A0A2P6NNG5_9EUKA|nr:hypothetical protein PROFUN_06870 [Planoprotostelium fungivorum]